MTLIKHLILSGGGPLIFQTIGIMQYLESQNIYLRENIKSIYGTSSGAIVGLFICLGYTYEELYKLMLNIDINIINDIDYEDITNFVHKYGFSSGNKIIKILSIFMTKKARFLLSQKP